jgi:DUF1009 family protein
MIQNIQKIGVIAGGSSLPSLLVQHCQKNGIPFHVVTFKGQPQPEDSQDYASHISSWALGQVGKVIKTFKDRQVTHIVMAGHLEKPSLFDLRFDVQGLKLMSTVHRKHDDELLSAVCDFLEKEGFKIVGAHELAPELLMPRGVLGRKVPSESQKRDIEIGLEALEHLSALDIGQAVVVKDGVVLGVEAVEGTAKLIERCAQLRGSKNKGGILIKAAKKGQNIKVDMPTIGDQTLQQLADFKFEGVAVLSGQALLLNVDQATKIANKHGLVMCGVDENGQYA